MGMFEDVLAWMDNKRRVAKRNASDLWNDPYNALQKTAANTLQTVRELPDDPANFIGGGVGSLKLVKGGRPPTPMEQFGLLNYEPPTSGAMAVPTVNQSGLGAVMKAKGAPKGADFSTVPDARGLYPVTVDGVAVFFEPTLREARNSAKIIDVDFWRGEMQNFSPANLRPFEPPRAINSLRDTTWEPPLFPDTTR